MLIEGNGFFQIQRPDGEVAYTRDGAFSLSADGVMVTADGFYLEPEITIPDGAAAVSISPDGVVSVRFNDGSAEEEVGQVELARFLNPAGLRSLGRNQYAPTEASGEPIVGTPGVDGFGTILSGYLEGSNVEVVDEMVALITAQRAYEINSKAITTADEMLQTATGLVR
jgi:flagellar basal-body rod protein FlgG